MKTIILAICLFFSALTLSAQTPPKHIPAFKFLNLADSSSFSQDDLKTNKKILLVFFDATCGYCKKSMKVLNSRHKELKKTNIVLVSLDDKKTIDMFITEHAPVLKKKKNVTTLRDTENKFIMLFKPTRYPAIFLYSAQKELILYTNSDKDLDTLFQKIAEK